MSSGSDRDLRRRFNRDPQPSNEPLSAISRILPIPPSLPPLRSLGSRAARSGMASSGGPGSRSGRYRPSDRFLERQRANYDGRPTSSSFEDLDRNLQNANSQLRALLDYSANNPIIPQSTTPSQTPDNAEESRRIKRRKLDSDRITSSFKGFRYGRYGQVEPGQLTMEIVSCDGGLYSDELSYAAENILKNDASVYCTKGNRCNIVLRHQGATVFSLKELIIKAPGSNYSSPVREGMVFISMNSDELLTRTAQYQIQYLPSRGSRNGMAHPSGSTPAIYSIRHDEDGNPVTRIQPARRRGYSITMEEDDDEYDRTAQIPSEFSVSPPPFNVTTVCSDDDSDGESSHIIAGMRTRRRTPNRIGALPFESDSDEDAADVWGQSSDWNTFEDSTRGAGHYSSRPHGQPSSGRDNGGSSGNMTLEEAQEASQIATQEAVRAVGGELMAPVTHFYIEKNKSKCTIRFDPPVSGRFILLKMWSPHHDPTKNIDIQSVIAKGFAGPRYFPAVELR
ncbi:hypothetical protein B0T22DRAFT_436136 [Podospora appendiculata]|uniref:Uncharacterized protein n=1 Tax=Podospora appendiculata TaxID=314037 RepID=A0AAE0XGA7_9PEZI|nr:hypothetical protein B0T22DRAFT_436136 [Podospora appendiculata]